MIELNKEGYVLITGASSGIGYEIAKLYASDGYNLILIARNIEKLKAVENELSQYNIEIKTLSLDISSLIAMQLCREIELIAGLNFHMVRRTAPFLSIRAGFMRLLVKGE